MTLSICIPSYNRGARALELVKSLLRLADLYEGELEIVVSNNGSSVGVAEYEQIASLQNKYPRYHCFEENQHFVGNFNYVVKMSHADYCMLLSDEDTVDEEALKYYMKSLPDIKEVGIVRAFTKLNYNWLPEQFFSAGFWAIKSYYMVGNYVSGIIYNRAFLTDEVIDELWNRYGEKGGPDEVKNTAYFYYPHKFVDAYLLAAHPIWIDSRVLVIEGREENDMPMTADAQHVYATWDARFSQMCGFREQIEDMDVTDDVRVQMYVNLIYTYIVLMGNCKSYYAGKAEEWNAIKYRTVECIREFLDTSNCALIREKSNEFLGIVAEAYTRFM